MRQTTRCEWPTARPGLGSASSISVTGSSYTPTSALTNEQTYYWQVRAKDGDDQKGTWSAVHSLVVNIGIVNGLSPADGSTTTDTTPTLSWTGGTGCGKLRGANSRQPGGAGQCVINQCNRQFLHADIGLDELADPLLAGAGKGWGLDSLGPGVTHTACGWNGGWSAA